MDRQAAWAKLARSIDGFTEAAAAAQAELIAIPAVGTQSGGPGEADKAAHVEGMFRALGMDIVHVDAPDPKAKGGVRPNVLGFLKGASQRRVWVLGHLDIVPPGEMGLWQGDPYVMRRDGDKIFGRGSQDNNQGLLSGYFAARAFVEAGITPPVTIALAAVSDEETGSALGLEHVLKTRPDLFSPDDLILVPDGGVPAGDKIQVAEKSLLWLKFTLLGKQTHGSRPADGRNTLAGTAHMIVALEELDRLFPASDPLFNPATSTFAPTMKEANVPNVNTIPGRDVFYLDCRVLPRYSPDDVLARAREIVERVAKSRELSVSVEVVNSAPAAPVTPVDAPVVRGLAAAIREVKGLEATPIGVGGGTVAAIFRRAGLDAAVWDTDPNTAHMPNEYCLLSSLLGDAKVMAHLALFA